MFTSQVPTDEWLRTGNETATAFNEISLCDSCPPSIKINEFFGLGVFWVQIWKTTVQILNSYCNLPSIVIRFEAILKIHHWFFVHKWRESLAVKKKNRCLRKVSNRRTSNKCLCSTYVNPFADTLVKFWSSTSSLILTKPRIFYLGLSTIQTLTSDQKYPMIITPEIDLFSFLFRNIAWICFKGTFFG